MQVPTIFLEVRDPGAKRGEPAGGAADGAGSIYGGEEEEGDGEHHRFQATRLNARRDEMTGV